MAIEVYRANELWDSFTGAWNHGALFHIAKGVSGSSSWEVIDSYSSLSTPNRFKGDPIDNGSWTDADTDVGTDDSWIVIQQKNPRTGYPAMQMKIQGSTATYNDVSGAGYKWEGTFQFNALALRWSPKGGWDLADVTPDFGTPTECSDNRRVAWDGLGSGHDGRWFLVMDDDFIFAIGRKVTGGDYWLQVAFYIADYNPKSTTQDTITNPARLIISRDTTGQFDPSGSDATAFATEAQNINNPVGILDENGLYAEWPYSCSLMESFVAPESQPNEFDSNVAVDMMEILIKGHTGGTPAGPDTRIIGSLKHIFRGYCLGDGALFDSKQWMCGGADWAIIFPWDGSTAV